MIEVSMQGPRFKSGRPDHKALQKQRLAEIRAGTFSGPVRVRKQDRKGWIYFLQARSGGPVKIGFSSNPRLRLNRCQVGSPVELRIVGQYRGSQSDEVAAHQELFRYREHGEWFRLDIMVVDFIRRKLGRVPLKLTRHGEADQVPKWIPKTYEPLTGWNARRARKEGKLPRECPQCNGYGELPPYAFDLPAQDCSGGEA